MADLLEIAPTVAALGSAGAATASWWSVVSLRKQWRVSQIPHLHVAPMYGREGLEIYVSNAGPGIARNPTYGVATKKHWTGGWADPARMFLRPGETWHLRSRDFPAMGDEEDAFTVAVCLDADGFPHLWDRAGAHHVLRTTIRRRPRRAPFAEDALEMVYPDLNVKQMERVAGTLSKEHVDSRVRSQSTRE